MAVKDIIARLEATDRQVDDFADVKERMLMPFEGRPPMTAEMKRRMILFYDRLEVMDGGGGPPHLFADASAYWPFASSKSLVGSPGPTLDFTRASASLDFNPDVMTGNPVEDFATGVPILLDVLGLGIWESRTNPVLWGRDLTQDTGGGGPWAHNTVTVTKTATGANGDVNGASIVTATAANATVLQTVTAVSAARAGQAFVKRSVGTGLIEFTLNGGTTWVDITASLSTGAWFNPKALLTLANPQIGFRIATSGDAIIVDYVDGQAGAFTTPPIPTTTAQVVRAADVCSTTDVSWVNEAAGAFYTQASRADDTVETAWVLLVDDGTSANRHTMRWSFTGPNALGTQTTVSQWNLTSAQASAVNTLTKFGYAYQLNDVQLVDRGVVEPGDTLAAMPSGLTTFRVGSRSGIGTGWINGHISEIAYWNTRKSNEFLQEVTEP